MAKYIPRRHAIGASLSFAMVVAIGANGLNILEWVQDMSSINEALIVAFGSTILLVIGTMYALMTVIEWRSGDYEVAKYRVPKPIYRRTTRISQLPMKTGEDEDEDFFDAKQLQRLVANTNDYFMGEFPEVDVEEFAGHLDAVYGVIVERRSIIANPTHFSDHEKLLVSRNAAVESYEAILAGAMRLRNDPASQLTDEAVDRLDGRAALYGSESDEKTAQDD